jgi:hypothetical protein
MAQGAPVARTASHKIGYGLFAADCPRPAAWPPPARVPRLSRAVRRPRETETVPASRPAPQCAWPARCHSTSGVGTGRLQAIVLDIDASDVPLHWRQELSEFPAFYDHHCYLPLYVLCRQAMLACYLRRSRIDGALHCAAVIKLLVKATLDWPLSPPDPHRVLPNCCNFRAKSIHSRGRWPLSATAAIPLDHAARASASAGSSGEPDAGYRTY